uniref:Mannose-P-dolichol utilization defect 1 protein homolog n=1 Tax=Oryza barthii TaxID=65489 RepID=A0A0D3GQY5_9ORYZ
MVAAAGTMELEILGINFGCVLAALADAKIPEKDCLLPLASKLLGYAIVAASTTVKLPQECLLRLMSKILGYHVVAASAIGKLPQILKILKHGSVRGLSVASFELEVVGYTIALAYCIHKGLPFSAYGELAFLLIQVLGGKIDPALFEVLYASQHAIFFFARLPQIWKNFMNKGTGELSFLTCFMNFAGSIVRVFTSIQEKTPLSGILLVLITVNYIHY